MLFRENDVFFGSAQSWTIVAIDLDTLKLNHHLTMHFVNTQLYLLKLSCFWLFSWNSHTHTRRDRHRTLECVLYPTSRNQLNLKTNWYSFEWKHFYCGGTLDWISSEYFHTKCVWLARFGFSHPSMSPPLCVIRGILLFICVLNFSVARVIRITLIRSCFSFRLFLVT